MSCCIAKSSSKVSNETVMDERWQCLYKNYIALLPVNVQSTTKSIKVSSPVGAIRKAVSEWSSVELGTEHRGSGAGNLWPCF